MPASIYAWLPEEREDEERKQLLEGLYRELDECTEVKITTRNRLKIFLPERGIWHISVIASSSPLDALQINSKDGQP